MTGSRIFPQYFPSKWYLLKAYRRWIVYLKHKNLLHRGILHEPFLHKINFYEVKIDLKWALFYLYHSLTTTIQKKALFGSYISYTKFCMYLMDAIVLTCSYLHLALLAVLILSKVFFLWILTLNFSYESYALILSFPVRSISYGSYTLMFKVAPMSPILS